MTKLEQKLKAELEMEKIYHLQARTAMMAMGSIILHLKHLEGHLPPEKVAEFRAACDVASLELDNYKRLFTTQETKSYGEEGNQTNRDIRQD